MTHLALLFVDERSNRFFARAWTHPRPALLPPATLDAMHKAHSRDLHLLLSALPVRFQPVIKQAIDGLSSVFSGEILSTALLHQDFGACNVMVNRADCHLVGVIDWAEASIGPFGLNMHILQSFTTKYLLKKGVIRYNDYEELEATFWRVLREEVAIAAAATADEEGQSRVAWRIINDEVEMVIKLARLVGLLMSDGFTQRLANMPEPVPINGYDERGAYNLLKLDGFLINQSTRLADVS